MEFFTETEFTRLSSPGIISLQLVSPHNSTSGRVTVSRVTVEPGGLQPRHVHQTSEQVWVALQGYGVLLLDKDETRHFHAGDVVRFAEGDVHGLENISAEPFVYLAVTAPPTNFEYAYKRKG